MKVLVQRPKGQLADGGVVEMCKTYLAYFGTGADSSISTGNGQQHVAAIVGLVAPFSRGNVTMNSTDTAINSIVNPNWLSDPRD